MHHKYIWYDCVVFPQRDLRVIWITAITKKLAESLSLSSSVKQARLLCPEPGNWLHHYEWSIWGTSLSLSSIGLVICFILAYATSLSWPVCLTRLRSWESFLHCTQTTPACSEWYPEGKHNQTLSYRPTNSIITGVRHAQLQPRSLCVHFPGVQ